MTFSDINNNPLFKSWPNGLIAVNHSGKIVALSIHAQEITGWDAVDAYQKTPHEVFCSNSRGFAHKPEDCPLLLKNLSDELCSFIWKKKNGENLSVDAQKIEIHIEECAYFIHFIDNSERLHNQEELSTFYEYVNNSPSAIAEFDIEGQIIFSNDAFNQHLEEFDFNDIGRANILPENIEEICARAIESENLDFHFQAEKKINQKFFRWQFQTIESSESRSLLGYAFDITALKEAEALAEERKNQSRKEYFAKMVHELRTPLNAIVGFSDILLSRTANKLSEQEIKRLKSIKNAGLQLNDLVTDTLDFSKIESGKMSIDISEFSISEVGMSLHDQMHTLAEQKGLEYNYIPSTQRTVFSDKIKVRQIIVNLVSNAVKYTKSGTVDLAISEIVDQELNECFLISVRDTGIGIPEDKIPKLFISYEQVESEATKDIQGTGLGLALVKDLVNLLGGKINVSSVLNEGSQFDVLLPYSSKFDHQP